MTEHVLGSYGTNCMLLVTEGACAVLRDDALHRCGYTGHVPKGIAKFFYLRVVTSFDRHFEDWKLGELGRGYRSCSENTPHINKGKEDT
eukprot:954869-Pelagomonas_calceolata.AAC.1